MALAGAWNDAGARLEKTIDRRTRILDVRVVEKSICREGFDNGDSEAVQIHYIQRFASPQNADGIYCRHVF